LKQVLIFVNENLYIRVSAVEKADKRSGC